MGLLVRVPQGVSEVHASRTRGWAAAGHACPNAGLRSTGSHASCTAHLCHILVTAFIASSYPGSSSPAPAGRTEGGQGMWLSTRDTQGLPAVVPDLACLPTGSLRSDRGATTLVGWRVRRPIGGDAHVCLLVHRPSGPHLIKWTATTAVARSARFSVCRGQAGIGALTDPGAFEIGEGREDLEHHPSRSNVMVGCS